MALPLSPFLGDAIQASSVENTAALSFLYIQALDVGRRLIQASSQISLRSFRGKASQGCKRKSFLFFFIDTSYDVSTLRGRLAVAISSGSRLR